MPSEQILKTLAPLIERLVAQASEDADVRSQLRAFAESILAATASPEPPGHDGLSSDNDFGAGLLDSADASLPVATDAQPDAVPAPTGRIENLASREPLPELTFARPSPPTEVSSISLPERWSPEADDDLELIASRCRIKAEACRWSIKRREMESGGVNFSLEIAPRDRALIAKAKALDDCYLWMSQPGAVSTDPQTMENVAGCFDATADVLDLLQQAQDHYPTGAGDFGPLLNLLAEAQSSLRVSVETIGGPTDHDQVQVFQWLKKTAADVHIFLPRYMKLDDRADPNRWAELYTRIHDAGTRRQEVQSRDKQWKKLLGKVRHKLSLVASEPAIAEANWQAAAAVIDELIGGGLPPSHRELREMLVPVLDELPEVPELPQGVQLVLREVDRFLATSSDVSEPEAASASPDVQAVADLLRGKSVVLIGGTRRKHAQHALQSAFGLKEVVWVETREHESPSGFQAAIAQPDVAVVLLAIRWASHSFGDIKVDCDRLGKPLVRLPRGYNPNQVAAEILHQASEALRTGTMPVR